MVMLADLCTDPEMTNWLKLWLAIDVTKTVLQQFVDDEMKRFHSDIEQIIQSTLHLPTNSKCTNCLTLNLIRCHKGGICKRDHKSVCITHKTIRHRPCPSNICDKFRDEIVKEHRYPVPSWKNTSAELWANNHWEVAKCYMPKDGYIGVGSSQDTDFNGIISVMLNCKRFDSKVSFSIAPKSANTQCVLTKAREIGKILRHSPKLKITDTDLQDYVQTLTSLLSDSTVLACDPNAQAAVNNLIQIQNDSFNTTKEEMTKLLKQAQRETSMKMNLEECLQALEKLTLNCTDELATKTKVEEFRDNLKHFYQEKKLHVQSNPLMPSIDKQLRKMYVTPRIWKIETENYGNKKKTNEINKYSEIIYKDGRINRRIFLQGDAGKGKSTFAKQLVQEWCNESSMQIPKDSENFTDVETLQAFRFLFHIELRNSIGRRDVETMIQEQIVNEIYPVEERSDINKLLGDVLKKEKCLLVQDGLDEWYDTEGNIPYPLIVTTHQHCTALITTRPYKMTDPQIKDSQIDCLLELDGVRDPYMLCEKLLLCLNSNNSPKTFKEYVRRNKLDNLLSTPMTTTMIVWYWLERGEDCPGSVCEIYTNIIDALLLKANNKTGYFQSPPAQCFKNTTHIEPNMAQVDALSKLAFHQLFCHDKALSLVFSNRELSQYLSEDQKEFALRSGILSETRISTATKLAPALSFFHKTAQEFLAAVYISRNDTVINDSLKEYFVKFEDSYQDIKQVFTYLCGLKIEAANTLSIILDAHLAKLNPYSLQSLIAEGYDEALANRTREIDIHLKLSNIDLSLLNKTEIKIVHMNKSNIISLQVDYAEIPLQDIQQIVSSSAHCLENLEIQLDSEYGELNMASCRNIKSLKITGQVTLLSKTFRDFPFLEVLSLWCRCYNLDLSLCNSLKDLELGGKEISFMPTFQFKFDMLHSLTLECKCDLLDLSLCPTLEKIELREPVTLSLNAFVGLSNIKSISLYGTFEMLDLSSCQNLESVCFSDEVKMHPNTLSRTRKLKSINIHCPCESLDLALFPNLVDVEIQGEVTLNPDAFYELRQLKLLILKCHCYGLNLSSCRSLENIYLKGAVILLPNALNNLQKLIYLRLDCYCSSLDLSTCYRLELVEIEGQVTLTPNALQNLRELVTLTLYCTCKDLDLSSCINLHNLYNGDNVVLLPNTLTNLQNLRDHNGEIPSRFETMTD